MLIACSRTSVLHKVPFLKLLHSKYLSVSLLDELVGLLQTSFCKCTQ